MFGAARLVTRRDVTPGRPRKDNCGLLGPVAIQMIVRAGSSANAFYYSNTVTFLTEQKRERKTKIQDAAGTDTV